MFDNEFYPTPPDVIDTMLNGIDIDGKVCLEPSAGKGDIIEALQNRGGYVLACEKNKDLAVIAAKKAEEFIGDDFFNVESSAVSHVKFIVMNPPFSNADKHILHAYDIAPAGCQIIALCNTNTLTVVDRNRYRMQLRDTIKHNGSSEDLNNVFSDAERKTEVNTSIVRLKKHGACDNEFDDFLFSQEEEESFNQSGVAKHDWVREIVGRYIQGVKMFDETIGAAEKINEVISPLGGSFNLNFRAVNEQENRFSQLTRDSYKKDLQKSAWRMIFKKLNMDKYLTSGLIDKINKFTEEQTATPFTMKNIYSVIQFIVNTHSGRMDAVLCEVFDWLTERHSENRSHVEGWKTNSMYFVGSKFIAPNSYIKVGYSGQPEVDWRFSEHRIDDLTKALCTLTGQNYDECIKIDELFRGVEVDTVGGRRQYEYKEFGKWYDFNFFEIKVFKKGTMHAKFKDEKVREMFNLKVAKIKGWRLPTQTGSDFRRQKAGVEVY
jgi:predicted RNA methylase